MINTLQYHLSISNNRPDYSIPWKDVVKIDRVGTQEHYIRTKSPRADPLGPFFCMTDLMSTFGEFKVFLYIY